MRVSLNLCKTPINTTDTLYFSSKEEQKEYFKTTIKRTIDASFNGNRNIRVNANYIELIASDFNYLYFDYKNERYYCFVDSYEYINDNCTEIFVTIDFIQTFIFDVEFKQSRIASKTYKINDFNEFISFSNKFPIASEKVEKFIDFGNPEIELNSKKYNYSVIAITLNPSFIEKFNENIYFFWKRSNLKLTRKYTSFNGNTYPFRVIYIPILYDIENGNYYRDIDITLESVGETAQTKTSNIDKIIETFSAEIIDISIIPNDCGCNFSNSFTMFSTDICGLKIRDEIYYFFADLNSFSYDSGKNINYNIEIKSNLMRGNYYKLLIGDEDDTYSISFSDYKYNNPFEDLGQKNIKVLTLYFYQQPIYPYDYFIKVGFRGYNVETEEEYEIPNIDDRIVIVKNNSLKVPFEVTAWADFYSKNMASVNDGLKTKQSFEKEIIENNMKTKSITGGIGIFAGLTEYALSRGKAGINTTANSISSIINASTTYENEMTNLEKEKALLEISWNDIKSSPSILNNINTSSIISIIRGDKKTYATKVYLVKPSNLEDIEKYHKIYGYETHRIEDISLSLFKNHTNFDYIRFDECNIISYLPKNIITMIKNILTSGIRFWYDVNHFLEFDYPNDEV